ncbi:MAG: glycine--tRNA ligase [bacterium]|nr:glycine--tRNA ligase [Candidatus Kapabacteria bacterium]
MAELMSSSVALDTIVSLAKRRGFVFQSSEIYGGLNGCWDYGPYGVELLRNVKEAWWRAMTFRDDIEGLDASILMHPRVWEASGHVQSFSDPMVDCRSCKTRYRVDILPQELGAKQRTSLLDWWATEMAADASAAQLFAASTPANSTDDAATLRDRARALDADQQAVLLTSLFESDHASKLLESPALACPHCGNKGTFTQPRLFNLMFKTFIGPVEDSSAAVYLRPETAQGIFVNFNNVLQSSRQKVPFGIAQIGKSFRNEINTKNFLFRTREFEQMEMQFFVRPGEDEKWYDYWMQARLDWFRDCGMTMSKIRTKPHEKLAHYARAAADIEYEFPFGWGEVEGIHNRGDFDLKRHTEFSGKKLEYFDQTANERFVPYVIETAAGASRSMMAFLIDAHYEEEVAGEKRTVLRFHPKIAPYKLAVLPLVNKEGMPEFATNLYRDVQKSFKVFYDESGAVGRRYRRQDEVGTPYCATVDGTTLEDGTITVRDRDSMEQIRIPADRLRDYVVEKIA